MVTRIRKGRALDDALVNTLAEEVRAQMQAGGFSFLGAFAYVFGMCKEVANKRSYFHEYQVAVHKKLYPNALGDEQVAPVKIEVATKPQFVLTNDVIRAIYEHIRKGWLSHGRNLNQGFTAVIGRWYPEIAGSAGLRQEAHILVHEHHQRMLGALAHEQTLNAPAD